MIGGFLDFFTNFCLKFGHITFILPIVLVLMIFDRRDVYAKATCFLLWVMIFNTLLKHLFKVPLLPHLGSGYAFPSGHMHAACAFYGYILYKTDKNFLKIGLAALLCCFGFSLIHCHFHDLKDVMGAAGFAFAEFVTYHELSNKFGDKVVGFISIVSAVAFMIALGIIFRVEFHVWLAFYGLVGMESALYFFPQESLKSVTKKLFALLLSGAMIAAVYYVFKALAFDKFYLSEIRFLIFPWAIVGAIRASKRAKI